MYKHYFEKFIDYYQDENNNILNSVVNEFLYSYTNQVYPKVYLISILV